jgi:SAM-dependent methyltransferase
LAERPLARLVGLDSDLEALALGHHLTKRTSCVVDLVCGTAYALPFADNCFTDVVCRVALNYMHQRRALAELCRVLCPGGLLYCRVEGPGHDLRLIRQSLGSPRLAGRIRNTIAGLLLASTGWQLEPGGPVAGSRCFGNLKRLKQMLSRNRCRVIHTSVLARYCGIPRSLEIVARKG